MFIVCIKYLEVVYLDDRMQVRHLRLGESFPDNLVNKKDLCLRVIDKMVDICRLELVKKRNRNGKKCAPRLCLEKNRL